MDEMISKKSTSSSRLRCLHLNLRQVSFSMRLRLLGFLLVLIMLLFLTVILILLLTGTLTSGQRELSHHFQDELDRLSTEIERDFGQISASAVLMAENIALSSELFMQEKGIKAANLQEHPELLQALLDSQFDRLTLSLEKTQASGAFIIYNATVNQNLAGSELSRAALYIKSLEPNIVSVGKPNMSLLNGFADLGRKRGYALHSLWSMEFDLNNLPEYREIEALANDKRELDELYKWGKSRPLAGSNEQYMPCIVPLIDNSGDFFGVCGFEVSSMLFKLKYAPETGHFRRISCLLCPFDALELKLTGSLISGEYTSLATLIRQAGSVKFNNQTGEQNNTSMSDMPSAWLMPLETNSLLPIYRLDGNFGIKNTSISQLNEWLGTYHVGLHDEIRLYPSDSAFYEQKSMIVLLMPETVYSSTLGKNNTRIALLCFLFIIIGVLAAVVLSWRFVRPIRRDLKAVASFDTGRTASSNILEIQQLIEQLKLQHEQNTGQRLPDNLFEDFLGRFEYLTPTEKQITDYYMHGLSTREILAATYISLSTLKTHSSHIYAKLNVSSRDELQLYYKLLDKSNRLDDL